MKTAEIISRWPGFANASAKSILASSAWRAKVLIKGESYHVTKTAAPVADPLRLLVELDGESYSLMVADSEKLPELHRLWSKRAELPESVMLALVERDCGELFQILETLFRRGLSVKGLITGGSAIAGQAFAVEGEEDVCYGFSLPLTDDLVDELGQLRHLDIASEELRGAKAEAEVEYSEFMLGDDEIASIAAGDNLLIPELDGGRMASARFIVSGAFSADGSSVEPWQDEGRCRIVAARKVEVTLGALLDGKMPPVPAPDSLILVRDGKALAGGRIADLVGHAAMAVEARK